ncbi:MAG: dipeptidyl carboxypeptidase II, partial [Luteimonas sp.]
MKHPLALALAAILGAAAPAYAQTTASDKTQTGAAAVPAQSNPLFTPSTLPLNYPAFDKIKDGDFAPAFDRGMADELKEVEAIVNNPDKPTFDNTILALEQAGQLLGRARTIFGNLDSADTNDAR